MRRVLVRVFLLLLVVSGVVGFVVVFFSLYCWSLVEIPTSPTARRRIEFVVVAVDLPLLFHST